MLKELRSVKNTPVIIISAKLEVYNRIELFKIGADDYITKPFDIDEVMLRIQAVQHFAQRLFGKARRQAEALQPRAPGIGAAGGTGKAPFI